MIILNIDINIDILNVKKLRDDVKTFAELLLNACEKTTEMLNKFKNMKISPVNTAYTNKYHTKNFKTSKVLKSSTNLSLNLSNNPASLYNKIQMKL